jgi:cysteine synthase A
VFCDFVGSGGTFAGCSEALKHFSPLIQCYVVEPSGCAVLAGKDVTNASHRLQGGGYGMRDLQFLRSVQIDGYVQVEDKDAIVTARRLACEEGLFAGFSSGANVSAALQLLHRFGDVTIAVILADSGLKYMTTDLWDTSI